MKHAYLIIAHNEFDVLSKLLQAIDDSRNDIYVHFDHKLKSYPILSVKYANLYILKNRVNVYWGHVSQIETEYALFEAAFEHGGYQYYHLISGVHFPLKSQDYIHHFFEGLHNQEVMKDMASSNNEIDLKLCRYNFFMKNYMHGNAYIRRLDQLLWRIGIRIQKMFYVRRNREIHFYKASNWVSVTNDCVAYLLIIRMKVRKRFHFTLCGDEFFIPSELAKSPLKEYIYYYDKLLKCDFEGGSNPRIYRLEDYEDLIDSDCLFARKFSHTNMDIVDKILNHITS